jgi:hypothetical protein
LAQYPTDHHFTPSGRTLSSPEAAPRPHDPYYLLDEPSSSSCDDDCDELPSNSIQPVDVEAVCATSRKGISSIVRAVDALKDGSRHSNVQLHSRTPQAGNGLPFAGLIDATTGKFRFAPGTSSNHFVRNSLSDSINAQLPRLYPVSAPEMQIKRFWHEKKGCWLQSWVAAAGERQSTFVTAAKKKNAVSFTVNTNLSPRDSDAFSGSGSGSKYRVDSAVASPTDVSSPQHLTVSSSASKAVAPSASEIKQHDQEDELLRRGNNASSFNSGITFLGHDAKSIAASATAPHMWRSWGAAAVRAHARHAVSASSLYREICAHAENLDEALHHLAESCSVWRHGFSVLKLHCAFANQKWHVLRWLRVILNVWKHAVHVHTFTLRAARQRALRLPKISRLFHSWRLVCLSSRVRASVAGAFTIR